LSVLTFQQTTPQALTRALYHLWKV
jgi:hypothetical protein